MEVKNVLYAAVGAPVVAARKMGTRAEELKAKLSQERSTYTNAAEKAIKGWATEGEKVVARISEGKVVEEISSKVDLDQAKEQVSKLRDQLEDMLSTWRHSFRPDKAEEKATEETQAEATASKPAAKKPAAKSTATKKPATKKPATKASAAETTKSSTAAKTSSAKSSSASKPNSAS